MQIQILKLAIFALLSAAATPATLRKVHVSIDTGPEVKGSFVAAAVDDGGHQAHAEVIGDCAAQSCDVEIGAGHWLVQWQAPGWWSPVQSMSVAGEDHSVTLKAFPTAHIVGEIVTERGDDISPNSLHVRFRSVDDSIDDERPCSILGSRFDCEIPSGTYDLRIRATRHVSHYLWGISASPEQRLDIGKRTFRTGASLVGYVRLARRVKRSVTGLDVLLTPSSAKRVPDVQQLMGLTLGVHPNEKGFFAFDGVPPGAYDLAASARGVLSQRVYVNVMPGAEAELNAPLVVDEPERLRIFLMPPLDPWGAKWRVEVEQERDEGRERTTVTQSSADSSGQWEWDRIASEEYRVVILDHEGRRWLEDRIDAGLAERHVTIPVTRIYGSAKLGDKPLSEATIRFESGTASIAVQSDDNGRFSGYLPEALNSAWRVHIDALSFKVIRELEDVHFRRDAEGDATLDVVVPLTHLSGRVVDADHHPINALVSVRSKTNEFVQTSAENGLFVVNGLSPGSYRLRAETFDKGESDTVEATVLTDGTSPELELVLRSEDQLSLSIVSDGGPVAGAMVWTIPTDVRVLTVFPLPADASGELKRPIPGGAREFDFIIDAPGFATRTFHHRLKGGDVRIRMNQLGGSLTLEYSAPATPSDKIPLVVHDGAVVGPFLLGSPVCSQRCRLSVVADGGEYGLCVVSPEEVDALRSAQLPATCARGFLPLGGTLNLTR